ncbi:MAG: hypothetical protein IT374_21545 [Polyangiaceae bacterium]|nr:hypothetical protein [Polyangiaceae bacterium]
MRNTAFVLVGLAFLVLQANLFRLLSPAASLVRRLTEDAEWGRGAAMFVASCLTTPNLLLPLIVFTGVHEYSLSRGAMLAFVLGYALDLFAAAPVGLFTFASVAVFVISRIAGVRLAAQTKLTQLALAFAFALTQGVMVMVLVAIFHKDPYVARAMVPRLLPSAISTALAAPLVFRLAERVHTATMTVPRASEGAAR